MFFKKKKIESLVTTWDQTFEVCPKGEFQAEGYREGVLMPECKIKHMGQQVYLVGYFDFNKAGRSSAAKQNRINKWILLFPSNIQIITYV